jgi:hypothetical protein
MKKTAKAAALTAAALLLCSSCAQQPAAKAPDSPSALINNIMSEAAAQASEAAPKASATTAAAPETTAAAAETPASQDGTAVDIDLTQMNSTMIYSVIYDMMINPDSYYGKSLLVDGYFDTMVYDGSDTRYFFVVVPDATACCVQGLEFILTGASYPGDYPEVQDDIRVRGVMDCYEEAGQMYTYIRADSLTKI